MRYCNLIYGGLLMRLTSIGLIAAATIGTTGIALSADLPAKAPAYAPPVAAPYNWTGSYVGGNIGYGWGSDPVDLNSFAVFPAGTVPLSLADKPRGVIGGIQYGTNWQFNRFVLGWDSDFSFSNINASQTVIAAPGGIATTISAEQKLDWLSTTRGRVGYLIFDNLLLYGTGGLASGRTSANTFITQVGCPVIGGCLAGSESKTRWGWAAGGGLEYAIGHWLVRAEYLHYDLGDHDFNVLAPGTTAVVVGTNKVSGDIVRGALSYKFDWTFWDLIFSRR
jgi:outer membrane immunogenic protein